MCHVMAFYFKLSPIWGIDANLLLAKNIASFKEVRTPMSASLIPLSRDLTSVMVVDDDPFGQDLLCCMLNAQGFTHVEVASNGGDALRQLSDTSTPPDYLIFDLFMPDVDGFELINGLVASRYKGGVILLSGVDPEMLSLARVMAQEQGLNVLGAFVKPMRAEALVKLLHH